MSGSSGQPGVATVHSQQIEIRVASVEVTRNVDGRTAVLVKPDAKSSGALNALTASSLGRFIEIRLAVGSIQFVSGDDTPELIEKLSSGHEA